MADVGALVAVWEDQEHAEMSVHGKMPTKRKWQRMIHHPDIEDYWEMFDRMTVHTVSFSTNVVVSERVLTDKEKIDVCRELSIDIGKAVFQVKPVDYTAILVEQ